MLLSCLILWLPHRIPDTPETGPATDQVIEEVRDAISQSQQSLNDYLARLQAGDRSRIARSIVNLFWFGCAISLLFVVVGTYLKVPDWDKAAEKLIGVLSSVILPVVTLVIGYYFGSEKKGAYK